MNVRRLWILLVLAGAGGLAYCGFAEADSDAVRQAPGILSSKERNINRLVPDVEFEDVSGGRHHLADFVKQKGVLVAVTSTSCPISKKYLPTLIQLAKQYSAEGFGVVLVNPVATDKPAAIQDAAAALGTDGVYVHDQQGVLCRALQVTSTTDVLLIDSARSVRYQGAINDQYGFGYSLEAPRTSYLAAAIAEYLKGEPIVIAATEAPGCRLDLQPPEATVANVTYHNRISRIVQANCLECHHEGGVAPFSLETREDVVAHAAMITSVLERGIMPPWFATPSAEGKPTPWLEEGTLTAADKRDLLTWLAGDHAEGDPQDAPLPMQFASGWTIGTPDLVAQFPDPVPVQATGFMDYQHVEVEIDVPEDKWVERIEIRPSAPEVVHHALVFALPPKEGEGDRRRGPEDGISYWGIYVPGNSKRIYPEGFARKLPKGSRLHFQMHYTPNGTATEDRTQVAFVFADREPEHEVRTASLVNSWFEIPPGDANYTDSAKIRLPTDVTVIGYLPHMHLRGKACNYEAITADGNHETLLDIPRYDFNWQLLYRLTEPRTFPKGTTLKFNATFDNSAGNPANPDPEATVRWGEQTYDEMIVGYVEYYLPVQGEQSSDAVNGPFGLAVDRDQMLFTSLDSNDDGRLTVEELKQLSRNRRLKVTPEIAAVVFVTLDKDQDGFLAVDEFRQLRELLRKKR